MRDCSRLSQKEKHLRQSFCLTLCFGFFSDFGLVLGCKIYVKELTMRARDQINQGGQGLCEGDVVTKINNTPVSDVMTLKEARKLVESCKERLNLVVTRELIREETVTNGNYQNNYNSLGKLRVIVIISLYKSTARQGLLHSRLHPKIYFLFLSSSGLWSPLEILFFNTSTSTKL